MDDATRSRPPELANGPTVIDRSEFVDEPEHYAVEGEIGAGGMGTVLAAKGSRLGRAVALKVVTVDRDDLRRRFEREAQVTARLQHPAIVPVYGSGRQASGRPFYAMKHVSGETLDKVVATTATLAQRMALLPRVIAVTEAIAYAHAEHVIHRDLKPGNILVGAFGETVVIDWGLAKDVAKDPNEDVAEESPYRTSGEEQTKAGKVMGTPAYMPLEQARGEMVDARADVYALGAILYHVLAGRPPYRKAGEDSVAWESMLARVLVGPPEPLPDTVPPDLRAIVARAMARDASGRYPTAGELAEDLRRFQTGQLVGAHRYSTWQLVRRWLRRHRVAVSVGVVAIVLLAVVGALSIKSIVDERARTEEQRAAAVASRGQAEDLMGFMLVDLRDKLKTVGRVDLLDDVAKKATTYYAEHAENLSDGEQAKLALARRNLGDVFVARGDHAQAMQQFQASKDVFDALLARDPRSDEARRGVAASHERIGDELLARGEVVTALAEFRAMEELYAATAAGSPDDAERQRELRASHLAVGDALVENGDRKGALAKYQEAIAISDREAARDPNNAKWQATLAIDHERAGNVLLLIGDIPGTEKEYRVERQLYEALAKASPEDMSAQHDVQVARVKRAKLLRKQGKATDARTELEAAAAGFQALVDRDPSNVINRAAIVEVHRLLGSTRLALGDTDGAATEHQTAIDTMTALLALGPKQSAWRSELALDRRALGDVWIARGEVPKGLEEYKKALEVNEATLRDNPDNLTLEGAVASAHQGLGKVLLRTFDTRGALVELRKAQEVLDEIVKAHADEAPRRATAASNRSLIASVLRSSGDQPEAIKEFRAAERDLAPFAAANPDNVDAQMELAKLRGDLGDTLEGTQAHREAIVELAGAVEIYRTLARRDSKNVSVAKNLWNAESLLANVQVAAGDLNGARTSLAEASTIVAGLAEKAPANPDYQLGLADLRAQDGDVAMADHDPKSALAAYREAIERATRVTATDARTKAMRPGTLAAAHEKVGDILSSAGDAKGAAVEYQAEAEALQAYAHEVKDQLGVLTDLAGAYRKLGAALAASGDAAGAKATLNRGLDLVKGGPDEASQKAAKEIQEALAKLSR